MSLKWNEVTVGHQLLYAHINDLLCIHEVQYLASVAKGIGIYLCTHVASMNACLDY